LFPHENSILETEGLEEERRLMYVAVTRARQRLYLSFAQSRMLHGQTRYNLRSRFLEEIPVPLTKWLSAPTVRAMSPRGGYGAYYAPSPGALAAKAPPRSRNQELGGLRVGQLVAHAKFGQGVIVAAEGSGADARVQVNFGAAGIKWLLLAVAKLEAA
jgi:DNA helicase-2/ATP-dependent DNA helicase PcrA